jgi:hypothetical protein
MRLELLQQSAQVVGHRRVQPSLGPSAAAVVLADEDLIFEDHLW